MITRRHNSNRAGLTLVELVLVLVVLTVLATVAVEMLEPKIDQSRFEATQQTIANAEDAIIAEKKNTDGTHFHSGFLADMGRLPQARLDTSGTLLTLSELWINPGVAEFRVRPADNAQGGVALGQEDDEVLVPCGWNGPYLQLAVGATTLTDGWGTQLATAFPAGGTYSHLRSRDATTGEEIDVMLEGEPVYGVRSLGRNNVLDPLDTSYDTDVPINLRITDGRISGVVEGQITVDGETPASTDKIVVQLYGPDETTGLVRVDVFPKAGFADAEADGLTSFTFDDFDADFNVKLGAHAIRAYRDNNHDGEIDSDDDRSQIVYFSVRPGINSVPDLDIVTTP